MSEFQQENNTLTNRLLEYSKIFDQILLVLIKIFGIALSIYLLVVLAPAISSLVELFSTLGKVLDFLSNSILALFDLSTSIYNEAETILNFLYSLISSFELSLDKLASKILSAIKDALWF
jgi:hypothetical protein